MRYIPLVTALFSTLGAAAQSYDSPATVAIDRDAPRSEIVAYSTLSDALTFDRAASRYLRPIADWQEERNESGRLLTGEFSMPFAWIDRELFLHVASAGSSYEVTVNATGEASMPYANSVLESWINSGFSTLDEIKKSEEEYKKSAKPKGKKQQESPAESSFATDDFFEAALRRSYGDSEADSGSK